MMASLKTAHFIIFSFIGMSTFAQSVLREDLAASNRVIKVDHSIVVSYAKGPLKQLAENPNYFTDGTKAIYLVGSHTWSNFQDMGFEGDKKFDYQQYMEFMVENHFNFMRLWSWEQAAWAPWTPEKLIFDPMPYLRTGPGLALDGKPKFDLTQFNQTYFDRMRARIMKAGKYGIYVSVMLFQTYSGAAPADPTQQYNAFKGHYYNKDNNIQKLNGDKDNDNRLDINAPEVRAYQEAYIKKIIDNIGDLENVLYEVINEGGNPDWDRFVVKTIRDYENQKGIKHPVGITGHGGETLQSTLEGPADWISPGLMEGPGFEHVRTDPPVWTGKKVSVLDTDHIWGHGIDYHWVWRSFLRGHNVLFMDPWDPVPIWQNPEQNVPDLPNYILGRKAMKVTAILASQLNLAQMKPSRDISSGGFCLMNPGKEYILYVPGDRVELDLTGITGTFKVEWIHPTEGSIIKDKNIKGGSKVMVIMPYREEERIAHLKLID